MDGIETDKLAKLIAHDRLSNVLLTNSLLRFAKADRDGLEVLLSAMRPEQLNWVYDTLQMYPTTDLGWTILPKSREPFLHPGLSIEVAADVDSRQYEEDRLHVEFLRRKIRP
ncbi:MAG: hypothetical protein AB7I37_23170 [Pirellulales bacterium]